MIYTFYSYKGGVGRTMALANIAELFYQAGLKVLMVDWDLEAPGLERYFPSLDLEATPDRPGVIDMLLRYREQMAQEPDGDEPLKLESPAQYVIDIYPEQPGPGKLLMLTAGRRSKPHFAQYAQAVLTFDWQDFYENWGGELYLDWLREQFEGMADVTLIDSRTGVTELGGVCTYQLADVVVMFCTPNEQSVDGTCEMAQNLTHSEVQDLRRGRPLSILVIPARIERAEGDLLNRFKEQFMNSFKDLVPLIEDIDVAKLWELRIPYIPKYAFKEAVAVRESEQAIAEDMAMAFRKLNNVMWCLMLSQLVNEQPEEAAHRLALAFSSWGHKDTYEVNQVVSLVERFAKPLGKVESLLSYARGMGFFAHGDLERATTQFAPLLEHGRQLEVAGVSLIIPEQIMGVQMEAEKESRDVREQIPISPPQFYDYPLEIQLRIHRAGLRYEADILAVGQFISVPIEITAQDLVVLNNRFKDVVQQVATGVATSEELAVAGLDVYLRSLAEVGNYAFKLVFDHYNTLATFQELLALGKRVYIQVASEDFFLPWELLYPASLDEPMSFARFWGMNHIISRVIVKEARPGTFVSPIIQVDFRPKLGLLTDNCLPGVREKEIPFFEQLNAGGKIALLKLRALAPEKKKEGLREFKDFCDNAFDLVHIACHAFYRDESPSLSYIALADDFPISLQDMEVYGIFMDSHPLVILNASDTGTRNSLYTSSFAMAFLRHGARGVVAVESVLPDDFAAGFAERLYTRLLAEEPLGESLLSTRRYFLEQHGNPLGLLYSMYASPSIRLRVRS